MFNKIKDKHCNRLFRRLKRKHRDKKVLSLDGVRSIGVICYADSTSSWKPTETFASELRQKGKQVHILVFTPKEIKDLNLAPSDDIHRCRIATDLNLWGLPKNSVTKSFFQQPYDILIDTLGLEHRHSQYAALKASASLKLVYATPEEDPSTIYDFILRGQRPIHLSSFYKDVIDYLSMIKK